MTATTGANVVTDVLLLVSPIVAATVAGAAVAGATVAATVAGAIVAATVAATVAGAAVVTGPLEGPAEGPCDDNLRTSDSSMHETCKCPCLHCAINTLSKPDSQLTTQAFPSSMCVTPTPQQPSAWQWLTTGTSHDAWTLLKNRADPKIV